MNHRFAAALLSAGIAIAAFGCGTSGESSSTTEPTPTTSTTVAETSSTTLLDRTSTSSTTLPITTSTTTTTAPITALPPCQELLQQYADTYSSDDLLPVAALFRQWAPFMPAEVAAASIRMAEAYEAVDGNITDLDMTDVDLTADAETFSDWTNEGCPAP